MEAITLADIAVERIMELVEQLRPRVFPFLAGQPPAIQGGVLADLLAIWLAGHCVPGDLAATRAARAELLADFLVLLERLVSINAARFGTPHDPIEGSDADYIRH